MLDDDRFLAFLDHRPVFHGHVLLIPRGHAETLPDLPPGDAGPLLERAQLLARAVPQAMAAAGTFVAINNGVSQSVPHLHVHVIPRSRGDGACGASSGPAGRTMTPRTCARQQSVSAPPSTACARARTASPKRARDVDSGRAAGAERGGDGCRNAASDRAGRAALPHRRERRRDAAAAPRRERQLRLRRLRRLLVEDAWSWEIYNLVFHCPSCGAQHEVGKPATEGR